MLSEDIIKMMVQLMDLCDLAYEQIKPEVDYIIKNQIKDVNRIDACLEQLLNIPTEKCHQLYVKLCAYYAIFNEQNAKEYLEIYDELYGDDNELTRKKTK